jgi:thiosulfate reductase cytochrome b subunit
MADPHPLYPLWLRAWHGLHALCFVLLGASGLSLHYSDSDYAVLPFELAVRVHDASGVAMAVLYVLFVVRNVTSGNLRHYSLPRPVLRSIARQLGWYMGGMFRGDARPFPRSHASKLNPAQASTYLLVMYAITPACVLSGVALLFPQLAPQRVAGVGGVWPMALLHLASGWLLSLFLLLHLYMVTTGPTLWTYVLDITRGEDPSKIPNGTADASSAQFEGPGGASDETVQDPPRS